MLHPERESLYCSTHMGVMPPTSVLAGNKTVCTVGMSGKQSKCLCMSHSENIPHHQAWTSLLAHCAVVACRLHSLCDGHEQCCLHGAWMNLLLLCSLYPAACLRDHSPPLPLFHPERKNLQRVCQFECWPRTLPQHQNQNAISHDIKPTMSFFQSWNSKRVSFFSNHQGTELLRHFMICAFANSDF